MSTATGGNVSVIAGGGHQLSSGSIHLKTQDSGITGNSGSISLTIGQSHLKDSGSIFLSSGFSEDGTGGNILANAGASSKSNGGNFHVFAGRTTASKGVGGSIFLKAGGASDSKNVGATGGNVQISAGESLGSGASTGVF